MSALTPVVVGESTPPPSGVYDWDLLAPTHYVSNRSDTGLGTLASPYNVEQARNLNPATLGEIRCLWLPGTYAIPANGASSAFNPVFDGIDNNRRVIHYAQFPAITATPAQRTILTTNAAPGAGGPVLGGGFSESWIIFDGFYINEDDAENQADSAMVRFLQCDHCFAVRMRLIGKTTNYDSNHSCIRIEECTDCTASDNHISDVIASGIGGNSQNHVGIMVYECNNLTISHNRIENITSHAIYFKDDDVGFGVGAQTVEYNYASACGGSLVTFRAQNTPPGFAQSVARFNLAVNCNAVVTFVWNGGTDWPSHVLAQNNTGYNCTTAGLIVSSPQSGTDVYENTQLRNNLIVGGPYMINMAGVTGPQLTGMIADGFVCNYNAEFNTTNFGRFGSSDNATRASWNAATTLDANSTELAGDPFVSAGSDFHLTTTGAGAVARTASSTGGPVGCYVTGSEVIGVRT